ncbi:hypothetical protein DSM104443_02282 [Usitatibacter rugosus]|uniref:Gylcosyl hydrolase 115 C-terminal domain-containing protein n=1 Tax=Usitatibacter rugosus TaxID=2732067 RepID=A0A6M4GVB8_9PROT|nr:glycosyl hydrolase 115 family protein [Usitatibacter rugosus]QJR11209.1 hypothetical protein DSM104443_02282 [Usitatibacter rugosus]
MSRWTSRALLAAVLAFASVLPAHALGEKPFVAFTPSPGAVAIANGDYVATLVTDSGEDQGVVRAAQGLASDIQRLTGQNPGVMRGAKAFGPGAILIGTLGKSGFIDGLAQSGAIDVSAIRGQWEGFVIQVITSPWNDRQPMIVIAGSDRRGTIYGIYTLAEQMGISPWAWWADVPVTPRKQIFVPAGTRVQDKPVVKYRGIFLNDEAPALTGWTREKFGGYNHKFYERVFELILRLRGNYLWPAMWPPTAFFADDPENGRLADEYGIVMATSHHEPMMRAHAEWHRGGDKGPWNYDTNSERLQDFWRGGIRGTKPYEKVVTLGMRGDGDEPMSRDANVALLERIVADQRRILTEEGERAPQVWALYKEVQEYYEKGMRVPDDVLTLWCDDNWGNIRRLPTPAERARPGGAGVYYHFDYVGGPRNYKWINVTPLPKVWEQMHLAWKYGATKLWIVNVGDLKPMEVPIEFFLQYAWNPERWPESRLQEFLQLWAEREFGAAHAVEIADLVAKYTKYNGRRKPEMLDPATYSLANYREAERIVAEYNAIAQRAETVSAALPPQYRDAFYQLVLYPVKAAAVVNELYVTAAKNRLYATQGRASTNDLARDARALFALDAELVRRFHQDIAGGKWNHMMSQTHLGYTYWNDPPRNVMPAVSELQVPAAPSMGVAVEGTEWAWPGRSANRLSFPALDAFERSTRYFEVFNRGEQSFAYRVTASEPWVTLSSSEGRVDREVRIEVGARWEDVPPGTKEATITVTGPDDRKVTLRVPVNKPAENLPARGAGFVETRGVVSIDADHFTRAIAPPGREWRRVPDHGRTGSGVMPLPVEAPSLSASAAMRLDYDLHLFTAGEVTVHATLAPTQKFQPGEGLRFAVSFDDEPPQIVNMHVDESRRYWDKTVADGVAVHVTKHVVAKPGAHTLKYWMLDPGLVLQKLIVDTGGLQPSYLGPPESPKL